MSIRDYLQRRGTGCPFCGPDEDIEGGSIEVESGTCSQRIYCLNCYTLWYDCYTLTSVETDFEEESSRSKGEEEARRQSRPDDVT